MYIYVDHCLSFFSLAILLSVLYGFRLSSLYLQLFLSLSRYASRLIYIDDCLSRYASRLIYMDDCLSRYASRLIYIDDCLLSDGAILKL